MTHIVVVSNVQIAILVILLGRAIVTDLKFRRIANRLVLAGLATALISHLASLVLGMTPLAGSDWWAPLTGLIWGLALLLPLHLIRAMGAGDVKLMAMVGAFIGPSAVLTATLYTLLAGGLLSLVFMFGRGVAVKTFANLRFLLTDWAVRAGSGQGLRLSPSQTTAARLPYALAIGLGTAASLGWPLAGQ